MAAPTGRWCAIAALAVLALTGKSRAESIAQQASLLLNAAMPSATVSLAPFDSSLGTLEAVSVALVLERRHSLGVWNGADETRQVPFTAHLTGTTVLVDNFSLSFADLTFGPANTFPLLPVNLPTFLGELTSGRQQFLDGQTPSFGSGMRFDTLSTLAGTLNLPTSFDGQLSFSFDPGVWTFNSANSFAVSLLDLRGSVTATYEYTPIPEPATFGLGALVLAGVITRRLHSRRLQRD